MKDSRVKTVAVIPAYNEEYSIAKVVLGTRRYVDRVIVCDDGSKDMTSVIAEELGATVVRHGENRGKGEALRTLHKEIVKLDPDIIITVDGDGQHNPDQIPMLVKPIDAGESDVVVGSRYVDGGMMDAPLHRRFGLRVINYLYKKVAGLQIKDTQCGFRAYSRKAFEFLMQGDEKGYGIEGEQLVLASRNGIRLTEVPISVRYNGLGVTSKKSALLHGADLMATLFRLAVEKKPLKYLGLPGIGLTFIGVILGLYSLLMFGVTGDFGIPMAILTVGLLAVGVLLIVVAITLTELKRISEKINGFKKSAHTEK
jgi:glycosyltransferase involved in cell wall biosynthesis